MRATWLLGGTGALLLSSVAAAQFQLVVNESSPIPGDLPYEGPYMVVAGSGGTVATISQADGSLYVMTHTAGVTTLITGPDGGFTEISELAFSPNGTHSFQTNNPSGNFALYQSPVSGGGITRLDATGTNIADDQLFADSHYQVNASGVAVYKYRSVGVQRFSTAVGAATLNTLAEGDGRELKNFNQPVNGHYRRQAVTASGSVVFYAETLTSTPGVYRMDGSGLVSNLGLSGITAASRVMGASDNAVLYTTLTGPGPIQTANLTLKIDADTPVTLASYADEAPYAFLRNAVMTQQNRVAYFDPGPSSDTASVNYYDAVVGDVRIIGEGDGITDAQSIAYTVKRLSLDDGQRTANPMVNDRGVVIFEAVLTPDEDEFTDVQAFLMWDTQTLQTQIVVKADGSGVYGDDFAGGKILGLGFDNFTNEAGDVLKDGLSEDNLFAFALAYSDGDEIEHIGVASVQVPEPSMVGALAVIGAGVFVRRRRSR